VEEGNTLDGSHREGGKKDANTSTTGRRGEGFLLEGGSSKGGGKTWKRGDVYERGDGAWAAPG